jgi:GTPase-associated protein 1
VWAEQAIFTSMTRLGKSGYHIVARSPGVSESDAINLATWSPSHGALVVDPANRTSVNFHPMPGGRYALSRTCEGPPEYSGRGGRQLYTHALIFDTATLQQARYQPFAIYRDALALGHFHYRAEPQPILAPVELSALYPQPEAEVWTDRARTLNAPDLGPLRDRLEAGDDVKLTYAGDRAALAECLLGPLEPGVISEVSFATSLQPSAVRPYRLVLVNDGH